MMNNQVMVEDNKERSKLTKRQFNMLESLYQQDNNPRLVIRRNLAKQLGMRQRTIQIWFQNRRAKEVRLGILPRCTTVATNPRASSSTATSKSSSPVPTSSFSSCTTADEVTTLQPSIKDKSSTWLISEFWATTMSRIRYLKY